MPCIHIIRLNIFREKFPIGIGGEEALFIAGNLLPDASMAGAVMSLGRGEALRDSEGLWAFRGTLREFEEFPARSGSGIRLLGASY